MSIWTYILRRQSYSSFDLELLSIAVLWLDFWQLHITALYSCNCQKILNILQTCKKSGWPIGFGNEGLRFRSGAIIDRICNTLGEMVEVLWYGNEHFFIKFSFKDYQKFLLILILMFMYFKAFASHSVFQHYEKMHPKP